MRNHKKLRIILLIVCFAVMAVSLTFLSRYTLSYFRQKRLEEMQAAMVSALPPLPQPAADPPRSAPGQEQTGPPQSAPGQADSTEQAYDAPPAQPDYKSRFSSILDDLNEDFYGLLSIPGLGPTVTDDFVVQASDNTYYLYRSIDRRDNDRGTLFLDYRALPWFASNNYVIYGHNMKDGTMFHDVLKYSQADTYLQAPLIEFDTIYGPTTWLVFAAYVCENDFYYYHPDYSNARFEELLGEIYARSNYHTGVDVFPSDTILTLSTCDYTFQDARFVVHARLLRDGEDLEGFTPVAENNNNKRPPVVPDRIALSDIQANGTAFTRHAGLWRNYFFQPDDRYEGIDWYTGSSASDVQGAYRAWNGGINRNYYSWMAAATFTSNGSNKFYIVSGGLQGDTPGLFVLYRNTIPQQGSLFSLAGNAPITPGGADARWPVIYTDCEYGTSVIYTVTSGGVTEFYSIPITGGAPRPVYTADAALDARPGSVIETEDGSVLLIQEFATGAVRALYLGGGSEAVETGVPARFGRFFVYLDVNLFSWRYYYEVNGTLSSGSFDIALVPRKSAQPADQGAGAEEAGAADDGGAGTEDTDLTGSSVGREDTGFAENDADDVSAEKTEIMDNGADGDVEAGDTESTGNFD